MGFRWLEKYRYFQFYLRKKIYLVIWNSIFCFVNVKGYYFSILRLLSKLLHPGNSWKLLKREAMRLFILWYSSLGEQADEEVGYLILVFPCIGMIYNHCRVWTNVLRRTLTLNLNVKRAHGVIIRHLKSNSRPTIPNFRLFIIT